MTSTSTASSAPLRVCGLVAAAGASGRMGEPKALLRLPDDRCVVVALAQTFRDAGLRPVVVTTPDGGAGAQVTAALYEAGLPVLTAPNPEPALGLSGSVRRALFIDPDADGLLLTPVDAPFATEAVVRALVAALRPGSPQGPWAAVPWVTGPDGSPLPGHPVAFTRDAFAALHGAGTNGGPRAVLEALDARGLLARIQSDDPALLLDLNTPADRDQAGLRPAGRLPAGPG
jgi:molybdenum cofactor cytidylyltransferase